MNGPVELRSRSETGPQSSMTDDRLQRIGRRFDLVRRLGAGGMAVVYDAVDRATGARVALKVLTSIEDAAKARFKREFRATQDLQHPNLVQLRELFEDGELLYFTMELVDGVDFLSFVRTGARAVAEATQVTKRRETPARGDDHAGTAGPAFDEIRLRDALGQLVGAVTALHDHALVHRDIKPSNILVTPGGVVRLLDFGLISDVSLRQSITGKVMGTVGYMAPEQADDGAVGPAADWYSVGVLLFEALTGRRPFVGSELDVLVHKQLHDAPPPRTLASGLPPDLDRLCESLLARVPARRPGGHQIAVALGLGVRSEVRPIVPRAIPTAARTMFVGRLDERRWLHSQYERARRDGAVAVAICGESGIGKTALVREVLVELRDREPSVLVLHGRCYENESVAYKGVDGIVEALAAFLRHLPPEAMTALAPRYANALLLQFAALASVPALASSTSAAPAADPRLARTHAMHALREILGRVTEHHPVVICVDDLQWIDADGRQVLHELVRPPEAPRVFLLLTHARSAAAAGAVDPLPCRTEVLTLGPLTPADARTLVTECAARAGVALQDREAVRLADEAQGYPIFLHELVHHAGRGTVAGPRPVSLEDVLRERVAGLPPASRALLELASVAGAPVPLQVAAAGAGLEAGTAVACVAELRAERLLTTSGTGAAVALQPSHDRVRRMVTADLDGARARAWHGRIATALEGLATCDAELLALHWSQAGDLTRAAPHAARAGALAARAFAFDRAAAMFRLALDGTASPDQRHELMIGLGDALGNAGRGSESARVFLACVAGSRSPDEVLALRHRAADQLLRSGHVDEGLDVLHDVLAAVRLRFPHTPRAAIASILYHRAVLALRGLGYVERSEAEVPPAVLRRLDVCYSVAAGLALVDIVRGTDFGTRCVRLALDAGEPFRLSRSLSIAACLAAGEVGRRRQAPALFALARSLAQRTEHAEAGGWLALAQGIAAFQVGQFEDCLRFATEAERIFSDQCHGASAELTHARAFCMWPLAYLGRLRELAARVPALLRDFRDRGDRLGLLSFTCGPIAVLALARDQPRELRAECRDGLANWAQRGFHFQHSCAMDSLVQADLYEGLVDSAAAHLESKWKEVERSLLLRVQFIRVNLWVLRGHVALAAAGHDASSSHLSLVVRAIAVIDRERMAWASGHALAMRAGLARLRGDTPAACTLMAQAEQCFAGAAMSIHVWVCQLQRGLLLGATGAELRARGEARLIEEGVRRPNQFAAALLPVAGPPAPYEASRPG